MEEHHRIFLTSPRPSVLVATFDHPFGTNVSGPGTFSQGILWWWGLGAGCWGWVWQRQRNANGWGKRIVVKANLNTFFLSVLLIVALLIGPSCCSSSSCFFFFALWFQITRFPASANVIELWLKHWMKSYYSSYCLLGWLVAWLVGCLSGGLLFLIFLARLLPPAFWRCAMLELLLRGRPCRWLIQLIDRVW